MASPRIVDQGRRRQHGLTRRSEYDSYIRNHGGEVEPLIDELEARQALNCDDDPLDGYLKARRAP
jgi:hypothetical protein